MSPRWGITFAIMNSKLLWLPVEDGGHQHPIMDSGGTHEAPPLLRSFWQLVCAGRGESFSFGKLFLLL